MRPISEWFRIQRIFSLRPRIRLRHLIPKIKDWGYRHDRTTHTLQQVALSGQSPAIPKMAKSKIVPNGIIPVELTKAVRDVHGPSSIPAFAYV